MKEKGMTLVEILIVIAFISVIVTVVIFGITKYKQNFEISGETSELIDDLNYAKQMSITEQIHYGVRFDFYDNSYQIIKYDDQEDIIKTKKLSSGIKVESIDDYSEVRFTFFGAVFKSGKVLLKNEDFSKIIEIKPSGFIYVERTDIN